MGLGSMDKRGSDKTPQAFFINLHNLWPNRSQSLESIILPIYTEDRQQGQSSIQ